MSFWGTVVCYTCSIDSTCTWVSIPLEKRMYGAYILWKCLVKGLTRPGHTLSFLYILRKGHKFVQISYFQNPWSFQQHLTFHCLFYHIRYRRHHIQSDERSRTQVDVRKCASLYFVKVSQILKPRIDIPTNVHTTFCFIFTYEIEIAIDEITSP